MAIWLMQSIIFIPIEIIWRIKTENEANAKKWRVLYGNGHVIEEDQSGNGTRQAQRGRFSGISWFNEASQTSYVVAVK